MGCYLVFMIHSDVTLALVLYLVFAVVCTAGASLIAAHLHSRRLAALVALAVAAFFVLLAAGLLLLVRSV